MSDTANSIDLDAGNNVLDCGSNQCNTNSLVWEYNVVNPYTYNISTGEVAVFELSVEKDTELNFDLCYSKSEYHIPSEKYTFEFDLNYVHCNKIYSVTVGESVEFELDVKKKLYHNLTFCQNDIHEIIPNQTPQYIPFNFTPKCLQYSIIGSGESVEFDFVFTDLELNQVTKVYDGSVNLNTCTPSSDFDLSDCGFSKIIPISGKSLEYDFTICNYPNPQLYEVPHDFIFNSTYNWACDLFGAEFGVGEGLTVELQPDIYMPFDLHYVGEFGVLNVLSATINFNNVLGSTGELALADLEDNPFDRIDGDALSGEYSDAFLTIYQYTFESDNYSSEYSDADLLDNPADQIDSDAHTGELAVVDIYNTITFDPPNYSGEYADADLEDNPSAEIDSDNYSSEYSVLNELYTYAILDGDVLTGELTIVDLFDNPAPALEALIYTSELGIVNSISVPLVLSGDSYQGEFGAVDSIWTSYYLSGDAHTGELAKADLTINLPEELSGIAYSGEYADGDSDGILDYHLLEFNDILTGQTAFDGLGVAGGINFWDSCCPIPHGDMVVFDYTENSIEVWDESGPETEIHASAELSVAVRFHIDTYQGESVQGTIGLEYIELDFDPMFSGENISLTREALETIRFCPGYLIPDGDNTIFDFASNINIGCYGYFTYAGEKIENAFLKTIQALFPIAYAGELAICSLTTTVPPPPYIWRFKAWTGEMADFNFNELFPRQVGSGEYSTVALERRKYWGYTGEKATCILERWYPTVEWITPADLCIPNEYYPMLPPDYRDPDYSYENYDICVEEMEYKGQVEAICVHFDEETLANYPFIVPDVMFYDQRMSVDLIATKRVQVNDVHSGEGVHTFELESEII